MSRLHRRPDDKRLLLIRGLPGSGKSTLAKAITPHHYETDDFFLDASGHYHFNPELLSSYHNLNRVRVNQAMYKGLSVIAVSNTFTQLWEMQPYFDMAQNHGYSVRVIKVVGSHGNIHGVPEETIEKMRERWEDGQGEITYESCGC